MGETLQISRNELSVILSSFHERIEFLFFYVQLFGWDHNYLFTYSYIYYTSFFK